MSRLSYVLPHCCPFFKSSRRQVVAALVSDTVHEALICHTRTAPLGLPDFRNNPSLMFHPSVHLPHKGLFQAPAVIRARLVRSAFVGSIPVADQQLKSQEPSGMSLFSSIISPGSPYMPRLK